MIINYLNLVTVLIVIIVTFSLSEADREIVSQLWSGPLEIESETEENLPPVPSRPLACMTAVTEWCNALDTADHPLPRVLSAQNIAKKMQGVQ